MGSVYAFNSNLTFNGYTRFENNVAKAAEGTLTLQEEGPITRFQSSVIFNGPAGVISLLNNQAKRGGAILATESILLVSKWRNDNSQ